MKGEREPRFRLWLESAAVDVLDAIVIGRDASCAMRLDSGLVSRRHARVYAGDDALYIEDLSSRNGVYVNRRKIDRPTALHHDDQITIGVSNITVQDHHVVSRPSHLSTLPPLGEGSAVTLPGMQPEAFSVSDADVPDVMTARISLDVLTDREREVMATLVRGHTNKEIAEKLGISVKTVETHRAHIGEKLGCRTRAELVNVAALVGLIPWSPAPSRSR